MYRPGLSSYLLPNRLCRPYPHTLWNHETRSYLLQPLLSCSTLPYVLKHKSSCTCNCQEYPFVTLDVTTGPPYLRAMQHMAAFTRAILQLAAWRHRDERWWWAVSTCVQNHASWLTHVHQAGVIAPSPLFPFLPHFAIRINAHAGEKKGSPHYTSFLVWKEWTRKHYDK